ncbi:MAG TPA: DUF3185 domain-containing protein [Chthoniobacterales bacterium]|jgi:hypothetical protein
MKTPTIVGIVLIIVGIVALSLGGFSITKRENVSVGPIKASFDRKERFPIPPLVGYAVLFGGIALVGFGAVAKKS